MTNRDKINALSNIELAGFLGRDIGTNCSLCIQRSYCQSLAEPRLVAVMKGESDMKNNWVEELVEHLEVQLEGGDS